MLLNPVNPSLFLKDTIDLSQILLGKLLVKETEEGICAGWIVETEAYRGPLDRAAHSFGNRRTKRTEVMFGPPGYVYTYVMHTHCLVNVVSGKEGEPEAVLIRAIQPFLGESLMYQRRGIDKKVFQLTNGPGKLTKAMGIVPDDYGLPFYKKPLYIAETIASDGIHISSISNGPRIGIQNSGEAKDYPWRFWITNNPFVSK